MLRQITTNLTAAALLLASTLPAAAKFADFKSFAKATGEVGVARSNCGFEMNMQELLALGRKFAVNPADAALQDKLAGDIAAGLADAEKRYHAEGHDTFCRNMLVAYGPTGNVVAGVLKPR